MRIISKFHDYYDVVQREGSDRSLVYLRHLEQYDGHNKKLPAAIAAWNKFEREQLPHNKTFRNNSKTCSKTEIWFGLALFAGKIYPYGRVVRENLEVGLPPIPDVYVYDPAELAQYAEEHKTVLFPKQRWHWYENGEAKFNEFFALSGSDRYHETALTEKLVVVFSNGGFVNVNGRLADIEFYRVMPTWQAFQELSMFLGNIAAPNNPMVVISDQSMIAKHGFDKWSFRKQKEQK